MLIVVWCAYLLAYVCRLGVGALAPFLKDAFHLSNAQIGGLTAASAIAAIPMLILGGWIVDRVGVRGALLAGVLATMACAIGIVVATSYPALLGVMALAGLSTGLLYPGAVKAILLWFPARERGTAIGVNQTAVNVAGVVSAIAMPLLAVAYGWRVGFAMVGGVAVAILIVVYARYADPVPWIDSATEPRHACAQDTHSRCIPEVTVSRAMILAGFASLLISGVEFALIAHLVLYLEASWGYSVVAAGALLAVYQAMGVKTKPISGLVSDRLLGARRVPTLLALCLLASIGCVLLAIDALGSTWLLYAALVLAGVGAGGWACLSGTLAGEIGGDRRAGVSVGSSAAFGNLGVAVGPPLFGAIVDWTDSYSAAWWMLSGAAIGALVLFGLVRETRAMPHISHLSDAGAT